MKTAEEREIAEKLADSHIRRAMAELSVPQTRAGFRFALLRLWMEAWSACRGWVHEKGTDPAPQRFGVYRKRNITPEDTKK